MLRLGRAGASRWRAASRGLVRTWGLVPPYAPGPGGSAPPAGFGPRAFVHHAAAGGASAGGGARSGAGAVAAVQRDRPAMGAAPPLHPPPPPRVPRRRHRQAAGALRALDQPCVHGLQVRPAGQTGLRALSGLAGPGARWKPGVPRRTAGVGGSVGAPVLRAGQGGSLKPGREPSRREGAQAPVVAKSRLQIHFKK